MEEPPKIDRLLSSHGITLSNASNTLKAYVSMIDHHHGPRQPPSSSTPIDAPSSSFDNGGNDTRISQQQDSAAAEEREEERLLARLNQLDPTVTNNRLGSISEDVYERLRMIMESVSAEAEGRVVSAVGVYASSKNVVEQSGSENYEGGEDVMKEELEDEFMKELEEAERLEMDYQVQQQQQQPKVEQDQPQQEQQQKIDYEQKKKDKKAKKAAKKAKKDAKKRKASSGGGDANEEKRIKVEEDQD
mmetsp:Transcript_21042/g.34493  ORF Transcript_21042/g.34493 Transcript_21042/m.34493 type:complete len:246 (+) Transcript_21042:97-834(+)